MMNYIKSQVVSDEAEPTISTVFIIGVTIVAAIWLFSRLFASTERKGADVSNCIAGSSSLSASTTGTGSSSTCNDTNSKNKSYDYGTSLS
jgi:hypothetical protein